MNPLNALGTIGTAIKPTISVANKVQQAKMVKREATELHDPNNQFNQEMRQAEQKGPQKLAELKTGWGSMLATTAIGTAIGVGSAAGASAIVHGVGKLWDGMKANATWNKLTQIHPEWNEPGPTADRAKELFQIVKDFSPDIAKNHTVTGGFIERGLRFPMVPHEYMKDLVSIQKDLSQGSMTHSLNQAVQTGLQTGTNIARNLHTTQDNAARMQAEKDRAAEQQSNWAQERKEQQAKDIARNTLMEQQKSQAAYDKNIGLAASWLNKNQKGFSKIDLVQQQQQIKDLAGKLGSANMALIAAKLGRGREI